MKLNHKEVFPTLYQKHHKVQHHHLNIFLTLLSEYLMKPPWRKLKVSYNYDKYFSSLAFTKIDANTINDNSSSTTGVDESITIRRIGAYDSKKLVFNTGLELTNAIYIDYTLNAVAGLNDPIERAGYVTHDASLKYKPSSNSSWTYFVAVNNISDKYYANHSTIATKSSPDVYRNEMGRDFRFSIKYEF